MKTNYLTKDVWLKYYANVYNLPLEIVKSNTFQDWLEGKIKTDVDSLLDWRLRLTQLSYNPLYKEDIEKLNNEIKAVDTILCRLYCKPNIVQHE